MNILIDKVAGLLKSNQTIKFNPSIVINFKQDFLSDYDFHERTIWRYGFNE